MFDLFAPHKEEKKEISRLLDNSFAHCLPGYQREIGAALDTAEAAGKTDLTQEATEAMSHYLERIGVMVDSTIRKGQNSDIQGRYAAVKENPALAGCVTVDGGPFSAGDLFRILYYAYTGKKAGATDAQRQDFLLGAYVDRALQQLEKPI